MGEKDWRFSKQHSSDRQFLWLCCRQDFDPDTFQYGQENEDSLKIQKIQDKLDQQMRRNDEFSKQLVEVQNEVQAHQHEFAKMESSNRKLQDKLEQQSAAIDKILNLVQDQASK